MIKIYVLIGCLLEDIRNSLLNLRVQLSDELQKISGSDRFSFIASHRGMFSRLGATPSQVEKCAKNLGSIWSRIVVLMLLG